MTNINLSQSIQSSGAARKTNPVDKGIYISAAIFAATLLIFGGLFLLTKNYSSKKAAVDSRIELESRNLEGKEIDRAADFQKRLGKISEKLSSQKDPNEILRQVGQSMAAGAAVDSFQQAGSNTLALKITADNFLTAAKQTLSFKKSQYFSNVQMVDVSRNEQGKAVFTLKMDL